jgi:hypothetical protein
MGCLRDSGQARILTCCARLASRTRRRGAPQWSADIRIQPPNFRHHVPMCDFAPLCWCTRSNSCRVIERPSYPVLPQRPRSLAQFGRFTEYLDHSFHRSINTITACCPLQRQAPFPRSMGIVSVEAHTPVGISASFSQPRALGREE